MDNLSEEERYWLQRIIDDQLGDEEIPQAVAEALLARQLIAWSHVAAQYVLGIRGKFLARP